MSGAIRGARILTPDESIETGTIVFDGAGRITAVGSGAVPPPDAEITDARGLTLAPGFIDLHVHGGGGFSLATRYPEEIRGYARWALAHGVTSLLGTICAGGVDEGFEFIRTAAKATGPVEGSATVLGMNLEGPFVNPVRRGALPKGWPAEPLPHLADRLIDAAGGTLRLMTVAPELNGADALIELLREGDVVVSIGHSDADYETAFSAFRKGVGHVTHLFNAMRPFHHRDAGIFGAAFDNSDITVEIIADGVHLDRTTVAMVVRLFGPERVALITDGVPPAGVDHGSFRLGEEEAARTGDRVLLPDGTIAGGAGTLDGIVRNVVEWGAAGLIDAVRMASTAPALVLGLSKRKGRIAPGYDADFVALDSHRGVAMTWVAGRLVYARGQQPFN
jgi:N-acetylglucosamine-6-phosphate deacetylase